MKTNLFEIPIKVFSTLMRHHVKLDASFLSLVIAVAVVEVGAWNYLKPSDETFLKGLGRSLDSELDLIKRAIPYVMSPGYKTKL